MLSERQADGGGGGGGIISAVRETGRPGGGGY